MNQTQDRIVPVYIEQEMSKSYIDYSMSVIVSRALPDVRDGLKPVHRRVLYGMMELGLSPHSSYKKSARIVGEVLGKYHPHGDSAVYDAMVRMVQEFSLRYPLVDGQGNFGSVDGDSPAAMRYTEARLTQIAQEVIRDIEKDTVEFAQNFDDTLKEPTVMPSLLPTLLVNGGSGIAVGMATNIPPHNLGEIVDALAALIEKPSLKSVDFMKFIKGPDFPTGALINGKAGIEEYFATGRGKLEVRARAHIEDMRGGRQRIILTEIPYQVNKSTLIEKTAELVRNKKIDGITEIRDESDREGMRVVFELRKETDSKKILKDLYRFTQMKTTFGVIMLALVDGQPRVMNMKEILNEFIEFRHKVVLRRTKFELDKAERRAHILEGLKIALDNIDEIIALIKKSRSPETAKKNLIKTFGLSEIQAQAILDMRLQRLTGLERKKIEEEYLQLIKLIEQLKSLLSSKKLRMQLVRKELLELKEKYGDSRRTQIIAGSGKDAIKEMMTEETLLVAISRDHLIKRMSWQEYQNDKSLLKANGAGDFIKTVFESANSHYVMFFSDKGKCYTLRTSFIPSVASSEAGASLSRLLNMTKNEKIISMHEIAKFDERFVFFVTRRGLVKKVTLTDLSKKSTGGLTIISLKSGDELIDALITDGKQEILLATSQGKAIRFAESDVREMGLAAGGIRGMNLEGSDFIIRGLVVKTNKESLLSITSLGLGKRCELKEYGTIKRGGKGIVNYKVSDKTGPVADVLTVLEKQSLMIVTKRGKQKRVKAKDIKLMGRASQGHAVATIAKNDEVKQVLVQPQIKGSRKS
ncbi:DNA gyrase subunit A [candidate division KSB1 bacterium]|nr:DNA gyrase subunit A [candidate division KSB1 bacterium]